jgi:hypothetical protein
MSCSFCRHLGGHDGSSAAAQDRFHARDHFAWTVGFAHVVIGAKLESDDAVDFTRARGQHDDRHVEFGADFPKNFEAG